MVDHPTLLRGLGFDAKSGRTFPQARPVLLERSDEGFIAALLRELGSEESRRALSAQVRVGADLELLQPVHRSFYVVVLEAACDVFGEPRLDPAKIASAGLVLRRLPATGGPGVREGWMRVNGEPKGWRSLVGDRELLRDPEPARRPAPPIAGPPEVARRLQGVVDGGADAMEEASSPLFVAPSAVCTATGRTILYGLVPVTSSERALREPPSYDPDEVRALLFPHFARDPGETVLRSLCDGKRYTAADLADKPPPALANLSTLLRALVSVFDAFEDDALLRALDKVTLEYESAPKTRPAGQVLRAAANALIFATAESFTMPVRWPKLTAEQAGAIEREAARAAKKRLGLLFAKAGRFEAPEARHELRAFVRVRREDGCPPRLVWSAPSDPFKIAAWYENGKVPPVPILLPRITRDNVKKLRPNVAFQVPGNLFDMLTKNAPKDFLDGKAKEGGLGLDWICGFNIPIITICAFIVLMIFLVLLNFVFWWLPFIRICIPIPRSR